MDTVIAISVVVGIFLLIFSIWLVVDNILTQHEIRDNTRATKLALEDVVKAIRRTNKRLEEIEVLISPNVSEIFDEDELDEEDE
jgi:hypothetical protein